MKQEHISDALQMLPEEILKETESLRCGKTTRRRKPWGWAAVAACLCLTLAAAIVLPHMAVSDPGETTPILATEDLPLPELLMLELPEPLNHGIGFEGVGSGGASHYNLTKYDSDCPWDPSMVFSTMPVYPNIVRGPAGIPLSLGKEEMVSMLEHATAVLGLEITEIEELEEGGLVYGVEATVDNIQLRVEGDGSVRIWFKDGFPLPEEYHFSHYDATDQEAEQVLAYLMTQFGGLVNFTQPTMVLTNKYRLIERFDEDHNQIFEPGFWRDYTVYDGAGDSVEDILNYYFNYITFTPDKNGNLNSICIDNQLCGGEKVGDYPVITVEEAYAALLAGTYLAKFSPNTIEDPSRVEKVELVYRYGAFDKYLMPYYRFYVDVSDKKQTTATGFGLKEYDMYYVPAIDARYIENYQTQSGAAP